MKIMDAGCGTGIVTRTLYRLASEKGYADIDNFAFDLSPNMLEIFRGWIENQRAKNIEVRQANVLEIETLPPNWNKSDLIISSTMLEYIPKERVKHALTNLRQLLAEQGILLIFVTKQYLITQLLARAWWKTNLFEKDEMGALLADAGFKRVEFKSLSRGWANSIMVIEAKVERQATGDL